MQKAGQLAAILAIVLGGVLGLPRDVAAHALLQSSDPAAGSTVASAPPLVTLTFGEAPDPKLSSVKVLDSGGRSVASGPAIAVPGAPLELQVPLGPLPDGVYTVAWRTVSAVDGHAAAGAFAFGVGVTPSAVSPGSPSDQPTSPSASPLADLARFVLYLGLLGLLGAGFVGAAVHPRPPRALARLAAAGWTLAAIGSVAVVAIQFGDTGADLGVFAGSALGIGVASRLLLMAGSALVVGVLMAPPGTSERWPFGLAAICAAGGILVDVLNGHAAASQSLLQVAAQWIHGLAAGVWMGGLAALLLSIRGAPTEEKATAVRRFSRWAGIALAALAVTGVLRAIQEVGSIEALVGSDFGRLVIIKSALLGLLGALGAINHFVSVPAAIRTLGPLRRVGRVEVSVGAVVLLATGILVNLAPPSSVAAALPPPAPPLVVTGHDFGTTLRVRLLVTPGTSGLNQFQVVVTDYDSGAPVPATGVTLRFNSASTSGLGESSLVLAAGSPGGFSASGGNLSLDGIWNLTAVVAAPSGAVEVPFAIATRSSVPVDANPTPGAPTIYTAHFVSGESLQVYLDPGRAGANELHETFFGATGTELAVASATVLVIPASGPSAVVAARELEPGHFVVDLDVIGSAVGADVVGVAPDGSTLHAHFEIPVQP